MKDTNEILRYFPNNIYQLLNEFFSKNNVVDIVQEIRLRVNRPIILKFREQDIILQYNISQSEILQILERLCENSIYAYKNQICEGFITIKGGHRVGLTGTCVIENGKIINVKNISSLQKVIVPMNKMYTAINNKNSDSSSANESDITQIQLELSTLQQKVIKQNEINRDLLRVHLEKIKMQIANFNNPYKTSKSVYAQTEKVGNFVELNV